VPSCFAQSLRTHSINTLFHGHARSPYLWKDPDVFRPERFSEPNSNPDFGKAWAGYRPEAQGSSLYPNEVAADFAFIPFGGGARKCVGDQFALLEATVAITMLLRCA
jgi:cytochrome P450